MSFYSLALKNIKKNFENYIAYFISTVASVMVFYIFLSLFLNKQIRAFSEISTEIVTLLLPSAVLVAVFTCVFLWHSTSFFIKSRKKELATYILLGMSKAQIGKMLLIENVLMRTIALFVGILMGTLFSKLFALILVSFMSNMINIQFTIIWNAVFVTIIVFYLIFLVDSVHAYYMISKYRLIELFNVRRRKAGTWRMPAASIIIALLFIGAPYAVAIKNAIDFRVMLRFYAIPIIFAIVAGTYILFNNIAILLVRLLKRNKRFYYNRINLLVTSQILYKMKNNAAMLAIIATLSAVTITAVGTAYVYYKTADLIINEAAPFSFTHLSANEDINKKVLDVMKRHSENKLVGYTDFTFIEASAELSINDRPMNRKADSLKVQILPLSQYNSAVELLGSGHSVSLSGNNECILGGFNLPANYENKPAARHVTLQLSGGTKLKVASLINHSILGYNIPSNFVIVTDSAYRELSLKTAGIVKARGYVVENQLNSKALSVELRKLFPQFLDLGSYYEIHTVLHSIAGVIMFVGIFIGVTFMLAAGSIIYYKQLIEANEDKSKYATLRKIGITEKEIRVSISRQLLIIFGMPLIVGICHGSVALHTLQLTLKQNIMQYFNVVMIIYIAAYAVFYILTLNSYIKTVSIDNE